jgi:hypothetical protein
MDFLAIECIGNGYETAEGGWGWKAKRKKQKVEDVMPIVATMLVVLWELSPVSVLERNCIPRSIYLPSRHIFYRSSHASSRRHDLFHALFLGLMASFPSP